MQGIKFYDPEIVGDTPETVEFKGLTNLVHVLRDNLGLRAGKPVLSADGKVCLHFYGAFLCTTLYDPACLYLAMIDHRFAGVHLK